MFDNLSLSGPRHRPGSFETAPAALVRFPVPSQWTVRFGRCEVRAAHREILVDGQLRPLQPRPFNLLIYLIEHRERVVTSDELLDKVWRDEIVQPGSLAAAIMRARKAVAENEAGMGQVIRTYQRVGYRFVATLDAGLLP